MGRIVCDVSVSADGFVAGPGQSEEHPLGEGALGRLHAWMFERPEESPAELAGILSAGVYIMGRNMFGPVRGEWDRDWRGWWGEEPPYHGPVFVLTHHPKEPLEMAGGTTFTFVTDGIESALAQARAVAGDRDIAIAGGAATINQYLAAGHIEELRTHVAPVTLGAGERLFEGLPSLNLEILEARAASLVTHIRYKVSR